MKKIFFILFIAFCINGIAQQPSQPATPPAPATEATPPPPPDKPKKEKIESMRIAFITQKLDLTPEEAQKFWPVYNEFHKKKELLHQKRREETKNAKQNIDSLSDKQIEAIVDGEIAFKQKNLDLEKEYHAKFKSVLPIRKVAKLYRAEEQFTHRLLEELSGRGKGGGHGGKRRDFAPPHEMPGDVH